MAFDSIKLSVSSVAQVDVFLSLAGCYSIENPHGLLLPRHWPTISLGRRLPSFDLGYTVLFPTGDGENISVIVSFLFIVFFFF